MYRRLFFLFTFFITSLPVAAQNPPSQLRRQYVIGFEPPVRDNKMHSIEVKVVPLKTPAKTPRMFVWHRKVYYSH